MADVGLKAAQAIDSMIEGMSKRLPGIGDLAELLGGGVGKKERAAGNKALAAELGVDVRTVQRYAKYERAVEQGQTPAKSDRNIERAPSTQREAFGRLQQQHKAAFAEKEKARAIGELKGKTIEANLAGLAIDPSGEEKDVDETLDLPPNALLAAMLDAYAAGDRDALALAFNTAFMAAWGPAMSGFVLIDVYGLDMTPVE